ncbi:hypothetical protein FH972_005496 [Carpinus fangiana]|uniref:MI domain-containing protein n=1 Tax=Carpinus fangiana TaxID=176857 RepID=A0A5N6QR96_9ROSI|nr:hypothetical protein FH972_005496 [Carpinus fangiana]
MEMQNSAVLAEEDLELERKLAKKLKVKVGKLRGEDDGINSLFEGIPSIIDSLGEEELPGAEEFSDKNSKSKKKKKKRKSLDLGLGSDVAGDSSVGVSEPVKILDAYMSKEGPAPSRKKRKKRKLSEPGQECDEVGDTAIGASNPVEPCGGEVVSEEVSAKAPAGKGDGKYVVPYLRGRSGNESEEYTKIRRHVRGLLNRLSESNVESMTEEISTILLSIARSAASQIISEEVLTSCSGGPRGNEQYAAVFGAFVAGITCLVGIDFGAKLMASLAKCFEDEYDREDNLSLRNITLLLSHLYIFGVFSGDLICDFLIMLGKRLTEIDVSTILTTLQCCGMKIRSDDPFAMKNFIQSVQNRVNELKASSGDGQEKINGKRMEFMLETILDIKNNKKRPKEDPAHHTWIKKWLQKLRVEDVLIRGLKWSKLLDPDKKGQWWSSGDMASTVDRVEEVASTIDKEVLEAQKMLQLAAAQRMNTDTRKAIFCIIMSGEDYIDAFEKLLRLDLHGKWDREIMRVLVECCLQEKVFNKYYTVLASKLCEHDKNKFTLQALVSASRSSSEGSVPKDPNGGSHQGIKTGRTYAEVLCSSSGKVAVSVGSQLLSSQEIDLLSRASRFELGNDRKDARTAWDCFEMECGHPASVAVPEAGLGLPSSDFGSVGFVWSDGVSDSSSVVASGHAGDGSSSSSDLGPLTLVGLEAVGDGSVSSLVVLASGSVSVPVGVGPVSSGSASMASVECSSPGFAENELIGAVRVAKLLAVSARKDSTSRGKLDALSPDRTTEMLRMRKKLASMDDESRQAMATTWLSLQAQE